MFVAGGVLSQSGPDLHGPEPGFPSCYAVPPVHLWLVTNQPQGSLFKPQVASRPLRINLRMKLQLQPQPQPRQLQPRQLQLQPSTLYACYSQATLRCSHAAPRLALAPALAPAPALALGPASSVSCLFSPSCYWTFSWTFIKSFFCSLGLLCPSASPSSLDFPAAVCPCSLEPAAHDHCVHNKTIIF